MLTVNALAAANRIIIPVQAEYLPAKGLEQLLSTVNKVKRQINPKLQIDGILLTMVDSRTNFAKEISALLRETYGSKIKVFGTEIPHSVRAKEISAEGKSIFAHDPSGKVAEGYKNLTKEVLKLEKQREKNRAGLGLSLIHIFNVNKKHSNVILGEEIRLLWGQEYITDRIGDISYQISPLSFYQVKPMQTQKLYAKALEYADLHGQETVWDLYCGIRCV